MKTIHCPECEAEIMIQPDAVAVGKAIEDHAGKHQNLSKKDRKALMNELYSRVIGKIVCE